MKITKPYQNQTKPSTKLTFNSKAPFVCSPARHDNRAAAGNPNLPQQWTGGVGSSFKPWVCCHISSGSTIDGWNPAPPRMMIIPLFIGFQHHPRWLGMGFQPSTVWKFGRVLKFDFEVLKILASLKHFISRTWKLDGWKMIVSFWGRGELLVSGRVALRIPSYVPFFNKGWDTNPCQSYVLHGIFHPSVSCFRMLFWYP